MRNLIAAFTIAATLFAATDADAQAVSASDEATVVLGRGAFAASSSWDGVVTGLRSNGYKVMAVGNLLRGDVSDAANVPSVVEVDRAQSSESEHVNAHNLIIALAASAAPVSETQARGGEMFSADQSVRNVVLVHGAFVDGSGWRGVYDGLTALGYRVTIVQIPLTSLEDDVAATTRALENQSGPTILVGHSWGGTVITEAGVHANVVGLVYLSAIAPDAGETTARQYEGYPAATEFVIDVGPDGFGFVRPDRFQSGFAADLNDADAAFLRDAQLPIRMSAFESRLNKAAWRSKPSWAIIPTEDLAFGEGMLLGMARRIGATIVETPGSHAAFITQAPAVVAVIDRAAREVSQPETSAHLSYR